MYESRNTEARSRNYFCRVKAMNYIFDSVCNLSFPVGKAQAPCLIAICGLSGYTRFFRIISLKERFSGKKVIGHKMCVLVFSKTFVRNISRFKNNSARYY